MRHQKLDEGCENYKQYILQSIENSEHRREMQRREEFDQDYEGRRNALEKEILEEKKRHQEFKSENSAEYLIEWDKHQKLNDHYQSRWNALEQERLKEIQMRKDFNQQKKEDIQKKLYKLNTEKIQKELYEFMKPKITYLEQWRAIGYETIFSEFKKEIEQLKITEDYRRARKDSKFGTHESRDREQKKNKERREPEQHYQSQRTRPTDDRTTLRHRAKRLAQIGHPTQSFQWMHLWPLRNKRWR